MADTVEFRYFPDDTVHKVYKVFSTHDIVASNTDLETMFIDDILLMKNKVSNFEYLQGEVDERDFDYYGFRKLWLNHAQVSLFSGRSYIPIHTLDDKQKFNEFIRGFKYLLEKRITSLAEELANASHRMFKDIADDENWKKFKEFSYSVDAVLEYGAMLDGFNEYKTQGGAIVISHSEIG